ncbi:hypothetical protein QAD02_018607 [Eretmocerus hayati]|uniref:Uncharacterized protein n=1 Tax=Eretmocerus hayati TaxID=131215 RepID=A0ACC2PM16_9HYME|nr:hypothetical protein QAD02_018607 [Eretmocerus hayati]
MAFALVREIIGKRYGERFIIQTKMIDNFSQEEHKEKKKYIMKINGKDAIGIVHQTNDDEDHLKQLLKKRSSPPILSRCETNLPSSDHKVAKGSRPSKQLTQTAKPKIRDNKVLKGKGRIDLSKVKNELAEEKKKEARARLNNVTAVSDPTDSRKLDEDLIEPDSQPGISTPGVEDSADIMNIIAKPPRNKNTKTPVSTHRLCAPSKQIFSSKDDLYDLEKSLESGDKRNRSPASQNLDDSGLGTPRFNHTPKEKGLTRCYGSADDATVDLKVKLKEKDRLINKQHKEIEDLKKRLQEKDDSLTELTRTNTALQNLVIKNFKELYGIVRDMKQRNAETADPNGSHLSVGFEDESNDMVHVGRDQWIPRDEWVYAFGMTHPKPFARYLALHSYGPETLKKSTISGKPSNRKKKKGMTESDGGDAEKIEKPNRLDPEKLEAIKDSTRFFLKSQKFDEWKTQTKESCIESVNSYLTTYISDMKKKPKTDKSQGQSSNKRKSSENVAGALGKKKKRERNDSIQSEENETLNEESGEHSGEELEDTESICSEGKNVQDQESEERRVEKPRERDNVRIDDVFDGKVRGELKKQSESENHATGEKPVSQKKIQDDGKDSEHDKQSDSYSSDGNDSDNSTATTEREDDFELNNTLNESVDDLFGTEVLR